MIFNHRRIVNLLNYLRTKLFSCWISLSVLVILLGLLLRGTEGFQFGLDLLVNASNDVCSQAQ